MLKTVGLAEPLRAALATLDPAIDAAFVFGSVAKGEENAASDIDLMIVADGLDYASVFDVLGPIEQQLARSINPTVMSRADFQAKRVTPETFVARVAGGPKQWVIGGEAELG